MPSTDNILDGVEAALLTVDGIKRVYQEFGDAGGNYEPDSARIRIVDAPSIEEWGSHRVETYTVELMVIVKAASSDRRRKMKLARDRMNDVIDVLGGREHATLGGVVQNFTPQPVGGGGIGEYKLDNKGEWAAAVFSGRAVRLVPY